MRLLLTGTLLAGSCPGAPAFAQSTRPEAVTRAMLSVERGCAITPAPTAAERDTQPARFGPILGTFIAGIAGNLVTSGINAIGNALEAAGQEKAFVAEGISSFTAYRVDNGGSTEKRWTAIPDLDGEVLADGAPGQVPDDATGVTAARCLVLMVPANGKSPGPALDAVIIKGAFAGAGISDAQASNAATRLKALGLTELPALYVEAELIGAADGMVVQPVLIRYASSLPGAPKGTAGTELHLSFAVPGAPDATDIGTIYALARIPLPKMAPGPSKDAKQVAVLNRQSLTSYASVVMPFRATTGVVDATLTARNGVVASIQTNKASQAQLKEAMRIAERALKDGGNTVALRNARDDAKLAYEAAVKEGAELTKHAKADPFFGGSTNVKARFVVIRDANQFLLAVAKALKSQAEATGTAITDKFKPQPKWTSDDTAFVEARSGVSAAEHALNDAIAAGKTTEVPGLQDALTLAKAKANEAAVTSGREPPYVIIP